MGHLVTILRQEVRKYASNGRGVGLSLYPILDDEQQQYIVVAIEDERDMPYTEGIVVFARMQNNHIIIEVDNTDKQLVDALLQQGIPREQITLAYRGEPLPDPVPSAGD